MGLNFILKWINTIQKLSKRRLQLRLTRGYDVASTPPLRMLRSRGYDLAFTHPMRLRLLRYASLGIFYGRGDPIGKEYTQSHGMHILLRGYDVEQMCLLRNFTTRLRRSVYAPSTVGLHAATAQYLRIVHGNAYSTTATTVTLRIGCCDAVSSRNVGTLPLRSYGAASSQQCSFQCSITLVKLWSNASSRKNVNG